MLSSYCSRLIACDKNQDDLNFAKTRNKDLSNVDYRHEDALNLSFTAGTFDKVIAVEVLEHVSDPKSMMHNICRVLKPNGIAIITFPREQFPFTYDPINYVLAWFSKKHLPIGAYAFGHHHLVSSSEFKAWVLECGFRVVDEKALSGFLVGFLELYWSGIVQRIFKSNFSNQSRDKKINHLRTRPGDKVPRLSSITRKITELDSLISPSGNTSLGMGYILQKK